MQVTPQLQQKLALAARTSMRIEGYRATASEHTQAQARALMARHGVKVSAPVIPKPDLQEIRL